MSRSINKGLDYTSLDVTFFQDRKIRRLQRKVDEYAPLVYIALLCTIFKEGYYIQWDDDVAMDLADASHLNEEYVSRVIDACLETELLSREMFEQHRILTSVGIQRQYKISCEKMKRKSTVDEYSLLIPSENKPILPNNSEEISETSEDNGQTSEEMQQSKVKETKGKEIEESKDSFSSSSSPSSEVAPSEDEKQEEQFLSNMFFRNWAAPNKEYQKFIAFNNTGGRCWAKMDTTQRMSALILWKQEPEQPKRPGLLHITGHLPRGCVVRSDGNQVFTGLDPRRDVESDGRDACFIVPREMAVHIQVNSLSDALEFEEQLFAVRAVERDFLAVEHEPAVEVLFARIRDQRVERIVRVDRMRHADHLPVRIIVVRLVELFPVLHHALHGVRERECRAFCLRESPLRIHVPDIFTRNVCRLCIQRKHDQCGEYAENCRNKSVSECDGANHSVCRVHFHAKPFLYVRKSRSFMLYPQLCVSAWKREVSNLMSSRVRTRSSL